MTNGYDKYLLWHIPVVTYIWCCQYVARFSSHSGCQVCNLFCGKIENPLVPLVEAGLEVNVAGRYCRRAGHCCCKTLEAYGKETYYCDCFYSSSCPLPWAALIVQSYLVSRIWHHSRELIHSFNFECLLPPWPITRYCGSRSDRLLVIAWIYP